MNAILSLVDQTRFAVVYLLNLTPAARPMRRTLANELGWLRLFVAVVRS